MREIMRQYGASVVASVIALFLFAVIGKLPIGGTDGIGNKVLQGEPLAVQEENSAMESYWRGK
jgi:hypothetical protein